MNPSIILRWVGGLRFEGTADSSVTAIDGNGESAPSPVSLLLEAIGACAGADVVDILEKGREEVRGLVVEVSAERRDRPPRFVKRLSLRFRLQGPVSRMKAERAVNLSLETYCSVFHSLRKDLSLDVEVEVEDAAA